MSSIIDSPPLYPNEAFKKYQGLGMTSQRTRDRLINRLINKGETDQLVLNILRVTPRHMFLDEAMATRAYEDTALPIGFGQTISQPLVVSRMSAWLASGKCFNRVLEIGTGSGYQTAVLAQLFKRVYSVERIEPLILRANDILTKLALDNIQFSLSDGHWGWPDQAPFDAILSAASPKRLPESYMEQLSENGRLVLPVGNDHQLLCGYEKTSTGVIETNLGEVLFVPMKEGVVNSKGSDENF